MAVCPVDWCNAGITGNAFHTSGLMGPTVVKLPACINSKQFLVLFGVAVKATLNCDNESEIRITGNSL